MRLCWAVQLNTVPPIHKQRIRQWILQPTLRFQLPLCWPMASPWSLRCGFYAVARTERRTRPPRQLGRRSESGLGSRTEENGNEQVYTLHCGKYHGCDGCWYCECSAFDKDIESEYCNEYCSEFETDESEVNHCSNKQTGDRNEILV